MSTDPTPSVARGDLNLQPSYFTSSLFVNPLREDVARLVQSYAYAYLQYPNVNEGDEAGMPQEGPGRNSEPFESLAVARQSVAGSSKEQIQTADASSASLGPGVRGAGPFLPDATANALPPSTPVTSSGIGMPTDASSAAATDMPSPVEERVHPQPFSVFKQLWRSQGWCWLHFKVFDGRGRESFINVVLRMFSGSHFRN